MLLDRLLWPGDRASVRIGEAIGEASLLRSYSAAEAFQEADTVALVRVGDWLEAGMGDFPSRFYKGRRGEIPRTICPEVP